MNYKRLLFLALFILLSIQIFSVEPALAAQGNLLETILRPFEGVNVGETYERYYYFVDAVLFFILFIGLAKFALKDKFAEAPIVPVVIGIILAIGMAMFERNTEFNIGKMWWFVGLIFFVLLGWMIFYLAKSAGANGLLAFSAAYILIYLVVNNTAGELVDKIENLELAGGIMGILFALSIVGVVMGVIKLIKGLKSGEWKLGSIGRKERGEDRKVRREQRGEEKALKKEKKAGEKMLKLEMEARNLDQKIAELEDLENKVLSMDLKDRQQQVELLLELERKFKDTWNIQKWLQQVYQDMSNSAYKNHESDIKNYTEKLNQLILSLQNILMKLRDNIHKAKEEYDTQVEKLFSEGGKKLSEAEKEFGEEVTNDQQFTDSMDKLKKLDVRVVGKTTENIKKIKQNISDRGDLIKKSRDSYTKLDTMEKEIKHLDQKNLDELDRMISICNKNAAEDIGKVSRAVSATLNAPNISSDIDRAITGQNEMQKVGRGLIEMWRSGKKYLSGDSLRQLYEGIRQVHANVSRISELMTARTEHYNTASKFIENYSKLQGEEFNTVKTAAKEELDTIKNDETALIQNMANIYKNTLLPIIKKISTTHNKSLTKEQVVTNIMNVIKDLDNFNQHQVPQIYNLDIQESVRVKILEMKELLQLFESKNAERKDGKLVMRWDSVKNKINKIAADLKKEMQSEIKILEEVKKVDIEAKAEKDTKSPASIKKKEIKKGPPPDIGPHLGGGMPA